MFSASRCGISPWGTLHLFLAYEEVGTCAVAKLNTDCPSEKWEELRKSKLDGPSCKAEHSLHIRAYHSFVISMLMFRDCGKSCSPFAYHVHLFMFILSFLGLKENSYGTMSQDQNVLLERKPIPYDQGCA